MKIEQMGKNIIMSDVKDFNLSQTLTCGQAFRWKETDTRTFEGMAGKKYCKISGSGDVFTLHNMDLSDFTFWEEYFNFNKDYSPIKQMLSQNDVIAKAIEYAPGIRILKQDEWEALCSFIISQNNNIKRISGIVERLCEGFGKDEDGSGHFSFPSAKRISELSQEDLQPIRAGFRARYIIDAARKVVSGDVDLEAIKQMKTGEAKEELLKIVGVGSKVADCVLLYGFGRHEVCPFDVWIKRAFAYFFPDGFPSFALPYAGIAQQYIFHYARHAVPELRR